jgi:hypothetical protein
MENMSRYKVRNRWTLLNEGTLECVPWNIKYFVQNYLRRRSKSTFLNHNEGNERSEKTRAFWDVAPCSLVRVDRRFRGAYEFITLMEAVRTSETSVFFNEITRCYITEGPYLHTRLKSHREVRGSICRAVTLNGASNGKTENLIGCFRRSLR